MKMANYSYFYNQNFAIIEIHARIKVMIQKIKTEIKLATRLNY